MLQSVTEGYKCDARPTVTFSAKSNATGRYNFPSCREEEAELA